MERGDVPFAHHVVFLTVRPRGGLHLQEQIGGGGIRTGFSRIDLPRRRYLFNRHFRDLCQHGRRKITSGSFLLSVLHHRVNQGENQRKNRRELSC